MLMQDLITMIRDGKSGFHVGPCPICGSESTIIVGAPTADCACGAVVIKCGLSNARDGLGTYCGAMLDAADDVEGLLVQLARWNRS